MDVLVVTKSKEWEKEILGHREESVKYQFARDLMEMWAKLQQKPDNVVVLLDLAVGLDVVQAIGRIRKVKERSKIIIITDNPSWREARTYLTAGASDYIDRRTFSKEFPYVREEMRTRKGGQP